MVLPCLSELPYYTRKHCFSMPALPAWGHMVKQSLLLPSIHHFRCEITYKSPGNIVVALRLWGHWWASASVCIRCDNLAVVQVVNNHKTKDAILGACVCNIWFVCALHSINLCIDHIRGNLNVKADLLSRLHSDKPIDQKLLMHLKNDHIWGTVNPSHLKLDLSL